MKTYMFSVSGAGSFPLDMLRYDCCFPNSPDDAANMHAKIRGNRTVTLIRNAATVADAMNVTEGRWASFGWIVTRGNS